MSSSSYTELCDTVLSDVRVAVPKYRMCAAMAPTLASYPAKNSVSNKLIIDFSFLVKTYYFDLFVALDKIQIL